LLTCLLIITQKVKYHSVIKSSDYLYEMVAGKSSLGNKWKRGRERERQREQKRTERQSIGEDQKWRELEITIGEDT
jgi:hypothetical protein